MKYKIRYNYNTGDSFGNQDGLESELELTWNNLLVAKANLQRIQEHYKYCTAKTGIYRNREDKKFVEDIEFTKPDWLVVGDKNYASPYLIVLYTDNGNPWQISAPWCGYFESLNFAEIVPEEEGMKFYT